MIALYPGSFDPITNGHLDVATRAVGLFDEVVIAVATGEGKQPLFPIEQRLSLIRESLVEVGLPPLRVVELDGLLVHFAEKIGAHVIVRGLRAVSDFEYEFQMALMNRKLLESVETIFLMPREDYSYLSSRMIKEIARLGGRLDRFVSSYVEKALREKLRERPQP